MTDAVGGQRGPGVTGTGRAYRRRWGDLIAAAVALVVVVVCGRIASSGDVGTLEEHVFRVVNDLPGALYPVMWPLQQLGNLVAGFVVAAGAAMLRLWRLVVAALFVTLVDLEPIMKRAVVRARPGTTVDDAVLRGDVPAVGQSFPSGHALLVGALAMVVVPYLRGRWRLVPWLLVAGVCVGRVYVGAHNPLDVVAGAALGVALGAAANLAVGVPGTTTAAAAPQPSPAG